MNFADVITARTAADALYFGDLLVRLTPATIVVGGTLDDLVAGAPVLVEGRIRAVGRIEATRIAIR